MSLPAELQNGKPEVGILADGVAGPSASSLKRRATNEAHSAVNDDGISLVALDHAYIEEAGIFTVHHIVERTAFAVAVILRCLHQPDLGVGERRDQIGKPIRVHGIICVDDADYLGVRRSVCE